MCDHNWKHSGVYDLEGHVTTTYYECPECNARKVVKETTEPVFVCPNCHDIGAGEMDGVYCMKRRYTEYICKCEACGTEFTVPRLQGFVVLCNECGQSERWDANGLVENFVPGASRCAKCGSTDLKARSSKMRCPNSDLNWLNSPLRVYCCCYCPRVGRCKPGTIHRSERLRSDAKELRQRLMAFGY